MSFAIAVHENSIDTDQPSVFIGGIPKNTNIEVLVQNIKLINPEAEFHLVTDIKNRSRGFAFIIFKTQDEAQAFAKIEHVHEGKILDCQVSLDYNEHITSSLRNIREPRKVFVDKIPKSFTKHDIKNTLAIYGPIDGVILIAKEKREINFAYVCFSGSESARMCVDSKHLILNENNQLSFVFARPKFSKRMLINMPALLKEYIRQIQKGLKEYDPKDFASLEVEDIKTLTKSASGSSGSPKEQCELVPKIPANFVKFTPNYSGDCKSFTGSTKTSGNGISQTVKYESQLRYFPPKPQTTKYHQPPQTNCSQESSPHGQASQNLIYYPPDQPSPPELYQQNGYNPNMQQMPPQYYQRNGQSHSDINSADRDINYYESRQFWPQPTQSSYQGQNPNFPASYRPVHSRYDIHQETPKLHQGARNCDYYSSSS
jgi:RNA recognition motif-containing protein